MAPTALAPVLDGLNRAALLEPMRQALGDATIDTAAAWCWPDSFWAAGPQPFLLPSC